MRLLWLVLGVLALMLGTLGAVLPLLPTVPFLLLAVLAFARSSDRLHRWIVTHPVYGQPIRDWQQHGRIRRRGKVMALLSMAASLGLSAALGVPGGILALQAGVLACVALYLVTRPG